MQKGLGNGIKRIGSLTILFSLIIRGFVKVLFSQGRPNAFDKAHIHSFFSFWVEAQRFHLAFSELETVKQSMPIED